MAIEMKDLSKEAQRQVLAQVMKTLESKRYRPTPTTRRLGEKELVFERAIIAKTFDRLLEEEAGKGTIKKLKVFEKIVLENSYITTRGQRVAAVKVDTLFSYIRGEKKMAWIDERDKKAERNKELLQLYGYYVWEV